MIACVEFCYAKTMWVIFLGTLRYTPRDELCNSIMGQIRRQMHTMSGAQMCVVVRAIAIAPRCVRVCVCVCVFVCVLVHRGGVWWWCTDVFGGACHRHCP
jgi:hypothetical protein